MYHDAAVAQLATIEPQAHSGNGAVNRILGALFREIAAERTEQRLSENRRAARREIAGLPAKLRYDLAFSDQPFETDRPR